MKIQGAARWLSWCLIFLLTACSDGSGRQGTDLVVSGSGPLEPLAAGANVVFEMVVRNAGSFEATDVTVTNQLSNQLIPVSVSCKAVGAAVCPTAPSLVMPVPLLAAGGELHLTVTNKLTATASGTVTNTLTANYAADNDRANNSLTISATAFNVVSDLVVTGSGPVGTVAGGGTAEFTVSVHNDGPDAASGLTFVNNTGSFLVVRSDGVSCVPTGGGVCPTVLGATMSLDTLPAGATLNFTISTAVTPGVSGILTNTFQANADTDNDRTDNTVTSSVSVVSPQTLGVTQSGRAQVTAGSDAVFTALLSNLSAVSATDLVLTSAVSATDALVDLSGLRISCNAGSGAACPSVLGPTMTVATLAAGRSLSFTLTLPVAAAARGSVTSLFKVDAAGDPDNSDNQASVTSTVVDPRNGSYKVVSGDGRSYQMDIDFDAGSYTMAGGSMPMTRSFTADASGGGYTVSGAQRLRVASDLIVGGHDFGTAVLPYVATRSFGTTVSDTVGTYNLMLRDVPASGAAVTNAAVVTVTGNQMLICQTGGGTIAPPGSRCPAGQQRNYVLSVSGNVYTAIEVGGAAQDFTFMLARSGASKLLLAALPAASAAGRLVIGLQDAPGLIGGSFSGPSSSTNWVDSIVLTASTYSATGSTIDAGNLNLAAVPNTGVGAMLFGDRSVDGLQRLWVMQASPMVVVFGDGTATGTASGLLQVGLP